jgi:hypothetical protein
LFVCFSKICRGGKWWLHKGNKIVLIGHSFGGIIIKSLTVEASKHASSCEKCKTFLECTKGMIFYAVPHSGRLIAQYVENYNKAFPHRLDGVLKKLKEFETEMETLSKEFEDSLQIPSKYKDHRHVIEIYSFAEQLPYNKVLVVPWTSVSKLRGPIMTLEANHMHICKPSMKGDRGYQKLLEILELCKAEKGVQKDKRNQFVRLTMFIRKKFEVNSVVGHHNHYSAPMVVAKQT